MDRLLSILVMNEGNLDRCLSGQTPKSIHKETNNTRLKDGVTTVLTSFETVCANRTKLIIANEIFVLMNYLITTKPK